MTELELVVDDGHPAVASRFFAAGSHLLSFLDELTEKPVDWTISDLHLGSAVARVASPAGYEETASAGMESAVHGLRAVAEALPMPDEWSPAALAAAKSFTSNSPAAQPMTLRLVQAGIDEADAVVLSEELTDRLAGLTALERRMPGAVRGTIVGVNVTHGNRASLKPTFGRVVHVTFANELRQSLKDALYQRVELTGEVRQDAGGGVFHVRADSLRMIAAPDLNWADLWGIDPEFIGGVDADTYLERTRGEA